MTIKKLALVVAILSVPMCMTAQKGTYFGIRLSPIFWAGTTIEDPASIGVPAFQNLNEFGFGGGLDVYFGLGKLALIHTGAGLNSTRFTNEIMTTDDLGNPITLETESRFGTIEVPIGIKLRLPVPEVSPTIWAQADMVGVIAFDFKEAINNLYGNDPATNNNDDFDINNFIIGFAPSAGVDIPIGLVKLSA
ncbi:MAG: hypothetical protein AAFU60_18695, partial [Bacteroidota bacterium]